jgi:phosphatidylglycerophosphatase A
LLIVFIHQVLFDLTEKLAGLTRAERMGGLAEGQTVTARPGFPFTQGPMILTFRQTSHIGRCGLNVDPDHFTMLDMNDTPVSRPDAPRDLPVVVPETTDHALGGRLAVWFTTGLGIGLVAPAPGTVGGLWGLPLTWAILQIPSLGGQLATIGVLGLLSVALCTQAMQALGGNKDPQAIVLDEIASVPIVFIGLSNLEPWVWVAGYLLLRVFDISKPPPCKRLERLPAGWGIMADDWMAAIYAALALRACLWVVGSF